MELQSLYLKESQIEKIESGKRVLSGKFWKRQFQTEATKNQKIFDWIFGVVLPTLCCLFDPLVFRGAISHQGAWLGEYKPFAYLLSFTSIVLMMLFLLFGEKLKWFNAVLAGLFLIGSAVSLMIGIVILPLSLIGLLVLIGFLGFTPLLAGFVYFRNSIRAIGYAEFTINDLLIFNLVAVSAIFSFVLPYIFQVKVQNLLHEMESGNPVIVSKNKKKLHYFTPLINVDKLALKTCGDANDESKVEIRNAVYELSGKNSDEISRQYCYDW